MTSDQDDDARPAGAALVTGAARGIGRALALALAEEGFDVAVHYRSSDAEAEAVAEAVRQRGRQARTFRADVTVEAQAAGLVDAVAAAFDGLDVLVNNVGDYHQGPLEELDAATWRHMFDSNLHATFYTCQRAVPLLRAAEAGRIVNLGYAGADASVARTAVLPYQAAKAAVELYTRGLAKREARYGTTANVIAPGVIENSVTKPLRQIPMGRPGTLEEVASAVRYLVSPQARYVTGTTVRVAGGWNL